MNAIAATISVFEYSNYRLYLADLYRARKAADSRFSHRYLAKQAGFTSPNFIKLVIDGKRNLSAASIEKLARALRLSREEAAFFRSLVLLNQAPTMEEKRFHAEQVVHSRIYKKLHPLKPAQFAYYAEWFLVPIRELVDTRGFREDPEWIARALVPPISPADARRALELLCELGILKRDERGKLVQSQALLSTGDEVTSASVAFFHREMLSRASEAIDRFPAEERDLSSLTMSLSEESALKVKALVQRFRKEVLEIARSDSGQTRVHQLNFQLFPVSGREK